MDLLQQSSQPNIVALHLFFGALPILFYTIFGIFLPDSVSQFTAVVLLSATNFWLVKNVTGRKLVGLRWWADSLITLDNDGQVKRWSFEAKKAPWEANKTDSQVFWWTLYGEAAVWMGLVVMAFLSVSVYWTVCAGLSLALHAINLIGYSKCDKDAAKRKAVGINY